MKYGDALPSGFNVPTSAFWLKKDLTPEGNPFKLVNVHAGDKVMDCGLYIGTFTAACMEQGAAGVRCYEAAPKNAALARANLERYGTVVDIVEAALTATDKENVELTMSNFSGANSILPSAHRQKSIRVPAVNFRQQLIAFQPNVIKLDVEGAEYDLLDSLEPCDLAGVRCVFVEFHPIADRDTRIRRIRQFFEGEGFGITSEKLRAFVADRDSQNLFSRQSF